MNKMSIRILILIIFTAIFIVILYKSNSLQVKEFLRVSYSRSVLSNQSQADMVRILDSEDAYVYLNVEESVKGLGPVHLPPDHPRLLAYIATLFVQPNEKPLAISENWEEAAAKGQEGQVPEILRYFNNKKGGYFIEAGAFDGEFISNTLYLEVKYGWTGLLVEPLPTSFKSMVTRNRKAEMLNACFSTQNYSVEVNFSDGGSHGGTWGQIADEGTVKVQCFPLYSVILAAGNPRIDLLSLDIEGAELSVLGTLPWDRVDIQSVLIEVAHSDTAAIVKLMKSWNYKIQKEFYYDNNGAREVLDIMFVKT